MSSHKIALLPSLRSLWDWKSFYSCHLFHVILILDQWVKKVQFSYLKNGGKNLMFLWKSRNLFWNCIILLYTHLKFCKNIHSKISSGYCIVSVIFNKTNIHLFLVHFLSKKWKFWVCLDIEENQKWTEEENLAKMGLKLGGSYVTVGFRCQAIHKKFLQRFVIWHQFWDKNDG